MLKGLQRWFGAPASHTKAAQQLFSSLQSYLYQPGQAVWSRRGYREFSQEGYTQNVIAHRAIDSIAMAVASVPWKLFQTDSVGKRRVVRMHPLLDLLKKPNCLHNGQAFFHAVVASKLISGNSYLLAVGPMGEAPRELHLLRADRVSIIAGKSGQAAAYRYQAGGKHKDYPIDPVTGRSQLLHLKSYNPLNDYYGLSPMEAAAYSIDLHNEASCWNKSLLQNGARPSGALVVKGGEGNGHLSEDQYWRIKQQVDEQFSGSENAGRPLLLEGGLDWREMSHSPKDMDYLEARHSAARDIALAFGVPPQLLGIPGDNTYSNLAEARLALWEQTVLPLLTDLCEALGGWLLPHYTGEYQLDYDTENIAALALRQEKLWQRAQNASFLSDNEKRAMVGLGEK